MALLVVMLLVPPLWYTLKYLNNCWMDYHNFIHIGTVLRGLISIALIFDFSLCASIRSRLFLCVGSQAIKGCHHPAQLVTQVQRVPFSIWMTVQMCSHVNQTSCFPTFFDFLCMFRCTVCSSGWSAKRSVSKWSYLTSWDMLLVRVWNVGGWHA